MNSKYFYPFSNNFIYFFVRKVIMKRGQLFGNVLIYFFIAITVIFLVIFGISSVQNIKKKNEQLSFISFATNLQNNLNNFKKRSFGSSQEIVLPVPEKTKTVCFVDRNKEINKYANAELSTDFEAFKDENVFFSPSYDISPQKISSIEIEGWENPLCVFTEDNKLKLKLISTGNSTKITSAKKNIAKADCVTLYFNAEPENTIDVVFLANGYSSEDAFASDVDSYIKDVFFQTKPFSEKKKKNQLLQG